MYGIFAKQDDRLIEGGFFTQEGACDCAHNTGWVEAVYVSRQDGEKPIGRKLIEIHPAEQHEGYAEPTTTGRSAF